MVAMTIVWRSGEARVDHQRPEGADVAHHVAQDFLLVPPAGGFGAALGESEVAGAGEKLLGAVVSPRLQQLFGPDHPERIEQLGADDVLSSYAAGEREIGDLRMVSP